MTEERKKKVTKKKAKTPKPRRGVSRKFPSSILVNLLEEGERYEIEFDVAPPTLEQLSNSLKGDFQWDSVVLLGIDVITDIREGDIIHDDKPLTNKVEGWKDILLEGYPDIILHVGRQFYHLIRAERVIPESVDMDFFLSQPSPTSLGK